MSSERKNDDLVQINQKLRLWLVLLGGLCLVSLSVLATALVMQNVLRPDGDKKPSAPVVAAGDKEKSATPFPKPSPTSPLREPPAEESKPSKETPPVKKKGTVLVIVNSDYTGAFDAFGSSFSGPWIYVDRELVKSFRVGTAGFGIREQRLTLNEGEQFIEVVFQPGGREFPLSVSRYRVTVVPDGETPLKLALPQPAERVNPLFNPGIVVAPTGYRARYQELIDKVDTQIRLYPTDALVLALDRALREVHERPPTKRLFVDLPERCGGPRQLNYEQVHLVVDWLQLHYWGWFPSDITRLADDSKYGPDIRDWDRRADLAKGIVRNHRDQINRFREIARRLEDARE